MNSSTSIKFHSKDKGSVFDVYEIQYDVQLAANIIQTRMKLGMTQEGLARKMKTVQPVIARAENGNIPPSHKLLKKIARAFEARLIPASFEFENHSRIVFMVNSYSAKTENEMSSLSSLQKPEQNLASPVRQFSPSFS